MWDRVLLKARGKDAFRRNYGSAVAVTFIMGLISLIMSGNSSASNVGNLTPSITYHVEDGH